MVKAGTMESWILNSFIQKLQLLYNKYYLKFPAVINWSKFKLILQKEMPNFITVHLNSNDKLICILRKKS